MKPCCWNDLRAAVVMLLLAALCGTAGAAQPYQPQRPDPVLEPWRWRTYPELNGLGLQCLTEGSDGEMWFGVANGAVSYDGRAWRSYTGEHGLLGESVNALCTTRAGIIYAGTNHGISRYRRRVDAWEVVSPAADGFPWNVTALYETADGAIWAGTAWGALRLVGQETTLYTLQSVGDCLLRVAPDLSVNIVLVPRTAAPTRAWGTGIGARVIEGFDPLPAIVWKLAPNGPAERAGIRIGDRITGVDKHTVVIQSSIDGQGHGGSSTVLTVARPGSETPFEVEIGREPLPGSYQDFPVFDVHQGSDGTMWFSVSGRLHGGEILRWDPTAGPGAWRLYTAEDGLQIGWRPRISQTRDGHIWVTSYARTGINRFDGQQWHSFRLRDMPTHRDILPAGAASRKDTNPSLLESRDGSI